MSDEVRRLFAGGRGAPRTLGTLSYEPRAVWHCGACDHVWIGTKDGAVWLVPPEAGDPRTPPSGQRLFEVPIDGTVTGGIRAISGCPCDSSPAWIVDRHGQLFRVEWRRKSHGEQPTIRCASFDLPSEPIAFVTAAGWGTLLLCDYRHLVEVRPEGLQPAVVTFERPVRWVLPMLLGPGSAGPLLAVGPDGTAFRVSRAGRRKPEPLFGLRHAPTCIAAHRTGQRQELKGVLYGAIAGLRLWVPPRQGRERGAEHALRSPSHVTFVRRVRISGPVGARDLLMVGGRSGALLQLAWDDRTLRSYLRSQPEEPRATPWPPLPGEVTDVIITNEPGKRADGPSRALFFMRDHSVRAALIEDEDALYAGLEEACGVAPLLSAAPPASEPIRAAAARWGDDAEPFLRLLFRKGVERWKGPGQVIGLGAAVLAAGRALRPKQVTSLALYVRQHTLRVMKDSASSEDWVAVLHWVRFVRKHFLLARTYDAKFARLRALEAANEGRGNPDRLIYLARLRARGFDVPDVWHLDNEPTAMVATDDGFGWAFRDGSVFRVTNGSEERLEVREPDRSEKTYRRYSNVLLWTGTGQKRLVSRPRVRNQRGGDLTGRVPDVHAALEVEGGRILVARRSRSEPLAWAEARGREVSGERPLKRGDVSELGRPRHRVLLRVERWVVLGGDDGTLEVFRLEDLDGATVPKAWQALSLDEPLVTGVSIPGDPAGRRGPMVGVGTASGRVLVFGLRIEQDTPFLALAFQDHLFGPLAGMAVARRGLAPAGEEEADCLAVLERSGRLTWYRLDRAAGPGEPFRGQRLSQVGVLRAGACIAAGPDRRAVVAGATEEGTWIAARVVCVDVSDDALRGACAEAQPALARAGLEGATVLDLLRCAPHTTGAVRAALLGDELDRAAGADPSRLLRDALRARPDDRVEFKALIRWFRDQAEKEWSNRRFGEAAARLCPIVAVLGKGDGSGDWRSHPKLRAALSRKITDLPLFRLASLGHGDVKAAEVRGWMEDLLLDEDPLVRLVTLQALAAALARLAADPRVAREVFVPVPAPGAPEPPPVSGATWIVDLCARVLATWPPPSADEHRCGPVTWSALVAVMHLLDCYPDSTLVLLHALATRGVPPEAFQIVARRRRRRSVDGAGPDRFAVYLPALRPGVMGVREHVGEVMTLALDGPDATRLAAQRRVCRLLGAMARCNTVQEVRGLALGDLLGAEAWPEVVLPGGGIETYYQRFNDWVKTHLVPLIEDLRTKSSKPRDAAHLLAAWSAPDHESGLATRDVHEPERSMLLTVRAHWSSIVTEPLPARGHAIDGWVLGDPIHWANSDHVIFAVRESPKGQDHPDGYVVSATTASDEEEAADRHKRWTAVAEAEKSCDVIPAVVSLRRGLQVWLVMRRVIAPGEQRYLPPKPQVPSDREDKVRVVTDAIAELRRRADAIASALRALHERGIAHGDVAERNLHFDAREQRYWLLDYGRSDWWDPNRGPRKYSTTRRAKARERPTADSDLRSLRDHVEEYARHALKDRDMVEWARTGYLADDREWAEALRDLSRTGVLPRAASLGPFLSAFATPPGAALVGGRPGLAGLTCFISYSTRGAGSPVAARLAKALLDEGMTPILDREDTQSAQPLADHNVKASSADLVVVLACRDYQRRHTADGAWVAGEWRLIEARLGQNKKGVHVVLLDDVEAHQLGDWAAGRRAIDGTKGVVEEIVRGLRDAASASAPLPSNFEDGT